MIARIVLICACIALSACMTAPHQAYNKSANAHIKKVGLVAVPSPAEYTVEIVHHPGFGFGLVGGLVVAADTTGKSKTFTQQQVEKYLSLGPELTTALREELTAGGYDVIDVDAGSEPRKEFLKDYPQVACDAYLDATIQAVGYSAQYPSTPYRPTLAIPVRLVSASGQKVLYVTHVYNSEGIVPKGATQLPPDPAFGFTDFQALQADPDRAAEGLKQAARRVAKQIVADLR